VGKGKRKGFNNYISSGKRNEGCFFVLMRRPRKILWMKEEKRERGGTFTEGKGIDV